MYVNNDLHTVYRPQQFEDVLGQDSAVKAVKSALTAQTCRSFLFSGPSGVGKTTLARIVANIVGCETQNLLEVDAATYSGIDAIRQVTEKLNYRAMGANQSRVFIVDECHALSKAAWQALLKSVEEPPSGVYWCFCTTDVTKVPATIRNRSVCVELKLVGPDLIFDLLVGVCQAQGFSSPDVVLNAIAEKSGGSPRRALTYLAQCTQCTTRVEVLDTLKVADDEEGDVINLCRALVKGTTWKAAVTLLATVQEQDPESIRMVILAYFTKVAMGATSEQSAGQALAVIEAFSEPCKSRSMGEILQSLGKLLLS